MSETIWAGLISAIPSIVSILTYLRVQQVHVQINSRMDQLIDSVRKEARASEQAAELGRQKEQAAQAKVPPTSRK